MQERDEYERGKDTLDALVTTLQEFPHAQASPVGGEHPKGPSGAPWTLPLISLSQDRP